MAYALKPVGTRLGVVRRYGYFEFSYRFPGGSTRRNSAELGRRRERRPNVDAKKREDGAEKGDLSTRPHNAGAGGGGGGGTAVQQRGADVGECVCINVSRTHASSVPFALPFCWLTKGSPPMIDVCERTHPADATACIIRSRDTAAVRSQPSATAALSRIN